MTTSPSTRSLPPDHRARLPASHSPDNAPIVTVIGAGIAGLTAAHDLAERGFLVQVVEANESYENHGEVDIGGLARTQWGRVKPAVSNIHEALVERARTAPEGDEREAALLLLRIIVYSRRYWIETLPPAGVDLHGTFEEGKSEPHRLISRFSEASGTNEPLLEEVRVGLRRALRIRRERFCYNLTRARLDAVAAVKRELQKPPVQEALSPEESAALAKLVDRLRPIGGLAEITTTIEDALRPGTKPPESDGEQSPGEDVAPFLVTSMLPNVPLDSSAFESDVFGMIAESLREESNERDARLAEEVLSVADWAAEALRREIMLVEVVGYSARSEGADVALQRANTLRDLLAPEGNAAGTLRQYLVAVAHDGAAAEDGGERHSLGPRRAGVEVIERLVPGEHGFRFFPRHYRNLFGLFDRIPLLDAEGRETRRSVRDNLLVTPRQALGMRGAGDTPGIHVPLTRTLPKSIRAVLDSARAFLDGTKATLSDVVRFQLKALRYLTSGRLRRRQDYEYVSWKDFIGLETIERLDHIDPEWAPPGWGFSDAMVLQLQSASQALLAFSAAEADARSYGNFSMQTLVDQTDLDRRVDLILNGPTTSSWMEPWKRRLERLGVRFFLGSLAEVVKVNGHRTELMPVFDGEGPICERRRGHVFEQDADFYVLALPTDAARACVAKLAAAEEEGPGVAKSDFKKLTEFCSAAEPAARDMSGLQFHFARAVQWGEAHAYYPESEWGLSAITQTQQWRYRPSETDGYFGLVSVDIAQFKPPGAPSVFGRGPVSIAAGAHWQIERGSPAEDDDVQYAFLPWPDFVHLDRGLTVKEPTRDWLDPVNWSAGRTIERNTTPYLATLKGQFVLRPGLDADRGVIQYQLAERRWVMAGVYMATHTRMMTMEGSCESGLHAARAIIRAHNEEGLAAVPIVPVSYNGVRFRQPIQPPRPLDLEDDEIPDLLALKELDDKLCEAGLPHLFSILKAERVLVALEARAATEADLNAVIADLASLTKHLGESNLEQLSSVLEALGGETLFAGAEKLLGTVFRAEDWGKSFKALQNIVASVIPKSKAGA